MIYEKDNDIIAHWMYTEQPDKKSHYVHTNDGHELYLFIKGDVSFSIDGYLYDLEPYDLLLISNKEIHRTIINSPVPHERIYIYFNPHVLSSFTSERFNLLKIFEKRKLGFANKINHKLVKKEGLFNYFKQIYDWSKSDLPEQNAMMISILVQLIVKVDNLFYYQKRDLKVKENVHYNEKIYPILSYISENFHKKITLDELEKKFFINKYYLCHLFKDITGFTVLEYITYKKISIAKELLQQDHPMNDICIQLGFSDYSNFYRVFKKITNLSPREYVEKQRGF